VVDVGVLVDLERAADLERHVGQKLTAIDHAP
jgi:hypothetical protein